MVTEEQIRELAYLLWEQYGYPEGKDVDHYYRAKQILEEREAASLPSNEPDSPASTPRRKSSKRPVKRNTGKSRPKKNK